MNGPLMLRRTHMRAYVAQGEAYRREIRDARAEADAARRELEGLAASMVRGVETSRAFPEGDLRVLVTLDRRMLERGIPDELVMRVRDEVAVKLMNARRDHRGDLRQTEMQRRLAP